MKVLSGLVGFLIFTISLPSASDTADAVRTEFFNKFYPQPACPITDEKKISIISTIESSNKITLNWNTYSKIDSSNKTLVENAMRNHMSDHCTKTAQLQHKDAAAANANLQALKAATDALNAKIRAQTEATAAATRNTAGSGNVSADGSSSKGLANAIGEVQKLAGRESVKEGEVAGRAAETDKTTVAPGVAQVAVAGVQPGPATIKESVANPLSQGPAAFTNKAIIENREVTLTDGSIYKYDKEKGMFTSQGKDDLKYEEMLKASGCNADESCIKALEYAKTQPEAVQLAQGATAAAGASTLDATAKSQIVQIQSQVASLKTQAAAVIKAAVNTKCVEFATATNTAVNAYATAIESCMSKAEMSDNLCSLVRSPKAILVQKLMSVGTIIINRQSSASDNCSAAQNFSRLAQQGLTLANVACTGVKLMCDASCAGAETAWSSMQTANAGLMKCGALLSAATVTVAEGLIVESAGGALQTMIGSQKPFPTAKITQCKKYSADIANMALQILSVADAGKQAAACKKALGDGAGGGTAANDISMDEFCKVPGQAENPPCLCRTQPTATGCPGALTTNTTTVAAANKASGAGVSRSNSGGVSAMATPGGLNGTQTGSKTSSLSDEAKAALGISDGSAALAAAEAGTASAFGSGSSDSSGGGSGDSGGSGSLAKSPSELAQKAAAAKKGGVGSGFDDFSFGGLSSLKWGPDGKTTINGKKYSQEEIKTIVDRKIASEEFHAQVTTASGKSNWDKVRVRYDENRSSLAP